jgi:serine phosphatase RsbU (regulator of sigma subunit)/ligand-binding sensor domain-containing protein
MRFFFPRNSFAFFLLFEVFFGFRAFSFNSNPGNYFITSYKPENYKSLAQNWAVRQGKDGLIYIGNTEGTLVFNGNRWETVLNANSTISRSIEVDTAGTVYIGASGDFGKLVRNARGAMHFESFANLLPEQEKNTFTDVWKIHCFEGKVIFQAFEKLFVLQGKKLTTYIPDNKFHFSFLFGNFFGVVDRGVGLKFLRDGKLSLPRGGEFFKDKRIYAVLPAGENEYFVYTRESGIFKVSTAELTTSNFITVEDVELSYEKELVANEVYCASKISGSFYAIGTLKGGIYILDSQFKLVEVVGKRKGILNNAVKDIFVDEQKGIWLALDYGISRVEIQFPMKRSAVDEAYDLQIEDAINFEGDLIFATRSGVKRIVPGASNIDTQYRIEVIPGTTNQFFSLSTILMEGKETLMATGIEGVCLIRNGKIKNILEESAYCAIQDQYRPDFFWVGFLEGYGLFQLKNNKLTELGFFEIPNGGVRRIEQDKMGNTWVGTAYSGIYRTYLKSSLDKAELSWSDFSTIHYDQTKGLPTKFANRPFVCGDEVFAGTYSGIYKFDPKSEKFIALTEVNKKYQLDQQQIYKIYIDPLKNFWIVGYRKDHQLIGFFPASANKGKEFSEFYERPFKPIGNKLVQTIFFDKSGLIWFGTDNGFYTFDAWANYDYEKQFTTHLNFVISGNDTLFSGYPLQKVISSELPYEKNSLLFVFSGTHFGFESELKFSYQLENFDSAWSAFSSESSKSYTNLPEGNYIFRVKTKNIFGKVSEERVYKIVILPPWYRTTYAYFFYIILGVLFFYGLLQISVQRLKRAKTRLEKMVKERTAEVVRQRDQVELQKSIVESKNKDITDSINYARKIQEAILPVREDISRFLPQSFVVFMPRDIVSGDFYWFSHSRFSATGEVFLAAVDCTGHGVPGAFMSMIGNTMLNEIVNEKKIYDPGEILSHLHMSVRLALRQNEENAEANDGMDISLVRFNTKTGELCFAGANRPLWILRMGSGVPVMEEVVPDKFPIGGLQSEKRRIFQTHQLFIEKGDKFFVFTDGYADQFGGSKGKKFFVKHFRNLLLNHAHDSMEMLAGKIIFNHLQWRGDLEQVDDILVMGISH